MGQTRAAWAETEITPPLGLPMGGRGPRMTPGTVVLDPLYAQALMLEDGAHRRALWISMDLIGMSHVRADPLRRRLAEATGTPVEAVLINFAHTHSGPMTHFDQAAWLCEKPAALREYERWLDEQLVNLALAARERLAPAAVRWHEGASRIGINRRRPGAEGRTTMGPNPSGAYNRDLWILHIETRQGQALAFAHGCHPVIVYGHAYDTVSADFPGQCRTALRQRLGEQVHVQFFQGLAGNVRPRILADDANERFRKSEPADAPAVGRELADDVCAALSAPGTDIALSLSAGAACATLEHGEPDPIAHWEAQKESDNELLANIAAYWLHRCRHGPPPMRTQSWPVGVMMLDDVYAVVCLAGEPVAEWLELLRRWLPGRRVVAWGYTQEVGGYLPTDALLPEGGYEVSDAPRYSAAGPAPLRPGIDEAIGRAVRAADAARVHSHMAV